MTSTHRFPGPATASHRRPPPNDMDHIADMDDITDVTELADANDTNDMDHIRDIADTTPELELTEQDGQLLLDLAEVAIRACLEGTRYPGPDVHLLPPSLLRPCAAFVSLHVKDGLNGCVGNLDASDPVGACVPQLALRAAFEDPRLPRLRRVDLDHLDIEIALLSPRAVVASHSRAALLTQLAVGVHGLVLAAGGRHAVFLPSVWEQLPDPDEFVQHLLHKAGLPTASWPDGLAAEVFTTTTYRRSL